MYPKLTKEEFENYLNFIKNDYVGIRLKGLMPIYRLIAMSLNSMVVKEIYVKKTASFDREKMKQRHLKAVTYYPPCAAAYPSLRRDIGLNIL